MQRPMSVLFYGVVLFAAGLWCLVWGFGAVGADGGSPWVGWLAVLVGCLSVYAGPAMILGQDGGRATALWVAGMQVAYVVFVASAAILGAINPGVDPVHLGASGILGLAVRFVLSMGALWALSGPEALAFTGGGHGHGHGGHGHDEHGHGSLQH